MGYMAASSSSVAKKLNKAVPLAIDTALGMMGDKYTLAIIERIYQNNAMRFLALEQGIPGISPRTLSIRLKQLEKDGLLHRQAYAQKPPKVEYTLTEKGICASPCYPALISLGGAIPPNRCRRTRINRCINFLPWLFRGC